MFLHRVIGQEMALREGEVFPEAPPVIPGPMLTGQPQDQSSVVLIETLGNGHKIQGRGPPASGTGAQLMLPREESKVLKLQVLLPNLPIPSPLTHHISPQRCMNKDQHV